jgi:hypothetical protein
MDTPIPGYDYGRVPPSPVSDAEFAKLLETAGFTDADRAALRRLAEVLVPQAESLVDAWRARIGQQTHLASAFFDREGKPDETYKAAVKRRFVQWVSDLCTQPFDRVWLDYQHEIGLRHTPEKKNQTDHAATPMVVPLRHLIAFIPHILSEVEARLRATSLPPAEIVELTSAWTKAVLLSVSLWARPYTRDGLW